MLSDPSIHRIPEGDFYPEEELLGDICLNCRFFRKHFNGNKGECHRYPPSPVFPVVQIEDWCGDFREKR